MRYTVTCQISEVSSPLLPAGSMEQLTPINAAPLPIPIYQFAYNKETGDPRRAYDFSAHIYIKGLQFARQTRALTQRTWERDCLQKILPSYIMDTKRCPPNFPSHQLTFLVLTNLFLQWMSNSCTLVCRTMVFEGFQILF